MFMTSVIKTNGIFAAANQNCFSCNRRGDHRCNECYNIYTTDLRYRVR